jgi:hypothetical protein
MTFLKFDLGSLNAGRTVEIVLKGSVTNVRLLDDKNLYNYVHAHEYKFEGGVAKKSPVRLKIPTRGHWYVVLDWKGLEGTAEGTVTILPE